MARKGMSRKLRLVPIDSNKNIVQFNFAIAAGAVVEIPIAAAVNPGLLDDADPAKTWYVEENAMIRGFNISARLYDETGVQDSGSAIIWLRKIEATVIIPPALPAPVTLAQASAFGAVGFKNRIFHIEQAITGSQVSGFPMGFPGIKIPKKFHATKRGDFWLLGVANGKSNQLRMCGLALYKWYR